ncbi:MAG TPA: VOC family protein [Anaerolineales bacterium]|nr:VOC family protein [Anaerolineales bacterium]
MSTISKRNVVHVEIPAANVEAAGKYYQELFGWKMQHVAEFDYTMWEDGSGYGGGFNKVSGENPVGQVLVYIDSDDIEADLKRAEELGGTIIRPKTEIPGTGWFGLFKDPTGNVLALYTSKNPEFNK